MEIGGDFTLFEVNRYIYEPKSYYDATCIFVFFFINRW